MTTKLGLEVNVLTYSLLLQEMVLESDDDGAVEADVEDIYSDGEIEDGSSTMHENLHPRDVENFLKLSEALTIFLADELCEADIAKADQLLRDYCTELLEVRYRIRTCDII